MSPLDPSNVKMTLGSDWQSPAGRSNTQEATLTHPQGHRCCGRLSGLAPTLVRSDVGPVPPARIELDSRPARAAGAGTRQGRHSARRNREVWRKLRTGRQHPRHGIERIPATEGGRASAFVRILSAGEFATGALLPSQFVAAGSPGL
jgi:hypothetical protein